jgi:uncharacterized cupredoxin-like copper-binding protein
MFFHLLTLIVSLVSAPVLAHADTGGHPASAADVSVTVVAKDGSFEPSVVQVKSGQTVKFVVRNDGDLVHELTIGDETKQLEHRREMAELFESGAVTVDKVNTKAMHEHGHSNSVLLAPGQTGEVIWTFADSKTIEFGCNVPGHYESGMRGTFDIE